MAGGDVRRDVGSGRCGAARVVRAVRGARVHAGQCGWVRVDGSGAVRWDRAEESFLVE